MNNLIIEPLNTALEPEANDAFNKAFSSVDSLREITFKDFVAEWGSYEIAHKDNNTDRFEQETDDEDGIGGFDEEAFIDHYEPIFEERKDELLDLKFPLTLYRGLPVGSKPNGNHGRSRFGIHWSVDEKKAASFGGDVYKTVVTEDQVDWMHTLLTRIPSDFHAAENEITLKRGAKLTIEKITNNPDKKGQTIEVAAGVHNFPKISWIEEVLDLYGFDGHEIITAYVMGSVAKGTDGPDSDLDITVVVEPNGDIDYSELNEDLLNSLSDGVEWEGRRVDIQIWPSDDPRIKKYKKIELKASYAPHTEECALIVYDLYDESKCTCGSPPPIVEGGANGDWKKEGYSFFSSTLDADDTQGWSALKQAVEGGASHGLYMRPSANAPREGDNWYDYKTLSDVEKLQRMIQSGEYVLDGMGPLTFAKDKNGKIVGMLVHDKHEVLNNWVHADHRRKGISTEMHRIANENNKRKLEPGSLTDDGKKFWDKHRSAVTAGMLDFPRKKLPEEVWLYEAENPLPRLQPKLRAAILSEARYRLSKFGAKLIGAMLYGGAATYQYKHGADIDVSLYIDWDSFKGDEEILQDAFKNVAIPWGPYEIHLFVKPSNQREQIEVADAYYDVMRDDWILPPLVLPKDFDPEIFFKPLYEIAEKKAQKIDLLMGEVGREWMKLKKALRALKEGARDEWVIREKVEVIKKVLLDKVTDLTEEFVAVWKSRRKMHDELRSRYVNDRNIGRFERFQLPEVLWKFLDEMGYVEYLKVLAKAHEAGVVEKLLNNAIPKDDEEHEQPK